MNDPVFDTWTWMSHKRALGEDNSLPGHSWRPLSWIPETHQRRMQAYTILEGYYKNAARHFLPNDDLQARLAHREYGDASLIVHQIVAALTGDDQSIVVELADKYDPDFDPELNRPQPPGPGATEEALAAFAAAEAELEKRVADNEAARVASEREEQLLKWADDERLVRKVMEVERDANKLGDAVVAVTWSNRKARPRIRVYDPGFYFPVLSDADDDFPSKVHLAWEVVDDNSADPKKKIRRITFELRPLGPQTGPDGQVILGDDGLPVLREGTARDAEGQITRVYPWNDEPSSMACFMTDAVFTLSEKATIYDLDSKGAEYAENEDGETVRDLDLEIDFLPVVHIPNTVAEKEHYGRSSLATILQILDDLQNADTDLEASAATSGSPSIALTNPLNATEEIVRGPGRVYTLGEGGRMDVQDSSTALDALLKYVRELLKRLSVNARLPEAVLGRLDPSEVPSGVALALAMGPLQTMVREMRLVRDEKYPLILKFVQRYMLRQDDIAGGAEAILKADLKFGSFLPSDRASTATLVKDLLQAKAISTLTAVTMLVEAGFPIEDAAEEVDRIRAENFAGALELLEATGNEDVVSDYLGVEVRPASTPEITLPGPAITEEPVEAEEEEEEEPVEEPVA